MIKLFTTWLMLAALSLNIVATQADDSAQNDDQVVASFERAFNHEPVPAQDVKRDDIDEDVLYTLVNKALQSEDDEVTEKTLIAGAEQ